MAWAVHRRARALGELRHSERFRVWHSDDINGFQGVGAFMRAALVLLNETGCI